MKNINGLNLMELRDVADRLCLSVVTAGKYLKEGKIKGQKIGREWYVTEENLERFIKGE